jgi:hypothetical protein
MSTPRRDAARLDTELAQLRAALRNIEAPTPDDAALRAQFRELQRKQANEAAAEHGGGSRWLPLAAAAAVVLALAAALTSFPLRDEAAVPITAAVEPGDDAPTVVGAFQPLLHSPGLPPTESYSVVRVRIPLSAIAIVPGTAGGGTIEADLLLGEDGLARAIRFNEADALLVSVADQ